MVTANNRALLTCSIHCQFLHRCISKLQRKFNVHISIVWTPTVYTVSTLTSALCMCILHCKTIITALWLLFIHCNYAQWHRSCMSGLPNVLITCPLCSSNHLTAVQCNWLSFFHASNVHNALPFMYAIQTHNLQGIQCVTLVGSWQELSQRHMVHYTSAKYG